MDDNRIREKIHRAVDVHGASMRDDPYLAQRILAATSRKEAPRMKKLSTGMIIVIVLMLLSVTAVAVGLTAEDIWRQSFEKMGTTGMIRPGSDATEAEISVEEAIELAKEALRSHFGTTNEEIAAMGIYPTYYRFNSDVLPYDSEWQIGFSSRMNVDLDYDWNDDRGQYGEYLVFINAATKEITNCNWYTNDFWSKAQRVWDCGNYAAVYRESQWPGFYMQSQEMQAYWAAMLAEKGYSVPQPDKQLHSMLLAGDLDMQFAALSTLAPKDDPQVQAAWAVLEEQCGFDAQTLQKYCYVASKPGWQSGYDDVVLHFSYELQWKMLETGHLHSMTNWLVDRAMNFGLYMVSFEPGTTNVAAITHVTRSESVKQGSITSGPLLVRTDWTAADLAEFDAACTALDRAVKRMDAAKLDEASIQVVVRDYFHRMGVESEFYSPAPEEANAMQWFAETSEWDELIPEPALSYDSFVSQYGYDNRFWPQEVMVEMGFHGSRMPHEGEMSIEQAEAYAIQAIIKQEGQAALDALGDYTINAQRHSLTADPNEVDCRWEVYITDDIHNVQNGWRVTFGEWETHVDEPFLQHVNDGSNG